MAQNTTGTANSVNPQSGTPNTDPPGVGPSKGGGIIVGDSGQASKTHIEYRFTAAFATHTTKQAG